MEIGKSIEISFGAFDSELKGWEYTIPEGMEAEIKNGKIIVREKESEDERVRKWLIGYFNQYIIDEMPQVFGNGLNVKDVIAWLEKQGEQNLANSAKTCKVEQNLAWSEDEKPLLEKFKQAVYDCAWGKVTCKAEGETKEEYANRWAEHFLLMVRDWADDYIDYTIQQKLRKSYDKGKEDAIKTNSPAWSEEDEKTTQRIVDTIMKYAISPHSIINGDKPNLEYAKEFESWLKSFKFRIQPQWKPSDEQMEAFYKYVTAGEKNLTVGEDVLLQHLYNDLKKLKG